MGSETAPKLACFRLGLSFNFFRHATHAISNTLPRRPGLVLAYFLVGAPKSYWHELAYIGYVSLRIYRNWIEHVPFKPTHPLDEIAGSVCS